MSIVGFALAAFFISALLTLLLISLSKKYGWYDSVNPRKIHKEKIPRLGGIAIFCACLVCFALYDLLNTKSYVYTWPLGIAAVLLFAGCILDDFVSLNANIKLLIQVVSATIIACSDFYIKQVAGFALMPILGRIITFFWIIGIVNSFNLIDGIDWLCGGISFLSLASYAAMLLMSHSSVGYFYIIVCCATAGFMLFNFPPAKIFLGDCGSQLLGFFVAVTPLFAVNGEFADINLLETILLVSIPCTDTFAAMWRRTRDHRSLFSPDRAHIHHKLINIGFSKTATMVFLLLLQVFICFAAFSLYFVKEMQNQIILFSVVLVLLWMFFTAIHYINRTVNLRMKGKLPANPQG